MHKKLFFDATVEIKGIDRKGMMRDVANVISDQLNINICKVTMAAKDGIFDGSIELRVHDRDELRLIMDSLRQIEGLQEVQRLS